MELQELYENFTHKVGTCSYNNDSDAQYIKKLIEDGANVNSRDIFGDTPLHVATKRCNYQIVKILIDNKAKIDMKDFLGQTPLEVAKKWNFLAIKKFLTFDYVQKKNLMKIITLLEKHYKKYSPCHYH
jgi:hypothetical protein